MLLLGACTVGPDYDTPVPHLPPAFDVAKSQAGPAPDLSAWWRSFDDPTLDALVNRVLSENLDVQQALSRVRQARARETAVRSQVLPRVRATTQAGYTRLSENALPSALTALGAGSPPGEGLGLAGEGFATYRTGLDASWELDVFGGQRRASEAAAARTDAATWSARDARVTVLAEVADAYQQLRSVQQRLRLIDETVEARRSLEDLAGVEHAYGLIMQVAVLDQTHARELAQAQHHGLSIQADQLIGVLSVLVATSENDLEAQLAAPGPAATLIEIPTGLPSELLRRRPDLRASERRLAAATAEIGVATAELYPSLSLTGALQLASRSLSSLPDAGSLLVDGGAGLGFPVLDRPRQAGVRLREEEAREAWLAYRAVTLAALWDVRRAMDRLDGDRATVRHLQAAVATATRRRASASARYAAGLEGAETVLGARLLELSSKDALVQAEFAAARSAIALYKALGGGWDDRQAPDIRSEDVPSP